MAPVYAFSSFEMRLNKGVSRCLEYYVNSNRNIQDKLGQI